MNKRLKKELGQQLVEKRGWHWALTNFAVRIWGYEKLEADGEHSA